MGDNAATFMNLDNFYTHRKVVFMLRIIAAWQSSNMSVNSFFPYFQIANFAQNPFSEKSICFHALIVGKSNPTIANKKVNNLFYQKFVYQKFVTKSLFAKHLFADRLLPKFRLG